MLLELLCLSGRLRFVTVQGVSWGIAFGQYLDSGSRPPRRVLVGGWYSPAYVLACWQTFVSYSRPLRKVCPHRVLSPPCSGTYIDTDGYGETKPRFSRDLTLLYGQGRTGRDTRCGQIAVRTLTAGRLANLAYGQDAGPI